MQQETITSAIEQAVVTTLSDMGFIDARLDSKAGREEIQRTNLIYTIKVLLPNVGNIIFFASDDLGRELIENMHGPTLEQRDQQFIDDTLGEMLNVIAGRIFQIISPNHPFELGLPIKADFMDKIDESSSLLVFKTPEQHTFCVAHHIKRLQY